MSRFFGLYRPWGFKQNAFMVFYTKNPSRHHQTIMNHYAALSDQGFFEVSSMFGLNYRSVLTYSKKAYPNYRQVHANLVKTLSNGEVYKPRGRINYWPMVSITDKYMPKIDKLDSVLKKIK